jgi:Na+-translocating ferredoxin:NAD+ oxidoreductase subunit A
MCMREYILLFISAAVVNNFVLSYFLGICPFIGVSNKIDSAIGMGMAVTFVMTLTATISWLINHFILVKLPFLEYVAFILVIATLVQLVEMFIRKTAPALYQALGIYLPLITTNCAILGLALFGVLRQYGFVQNLFSALGPASALRWPLLLWRAFGKNWKPPTCRRPCKAPVSR